MIYRAPFGSMERFISILIEHTAGKFPLWMAPEQYALLPINTTDEILSYCKEVQAWLSDLGVRGSIDERNETIGKKIRETELRKVPFMLIVGDKEKENQTVSVRRQGEGDQGAMAIKDFAELVEKG